MNKYRCYKGKQRTRPLEKQLVECFYSWVYTNMLFINHNCINRSPQNIKYKDIYDHNQFGLKHIEAEKNGRHFADDVFKCIFLNENIWILLKISLKFVLKGPINNILSLVQIMAWRRPGDKPLSEPMMVSLLTHICVARPQWVKHQGSTK